MVKHWINHHPEETTQPESRFKIKAAYKDCLSRQVAEAIHIHYSRDELLNSKKE